MKTVLSVSVVLMAARSITASTSDRPVLRTPPSVRKTPSVALDGRWVRRSQTGGWIKLDFMDTGRVEADLDGDGRVDVVSRFAVAGDTVRFEDREGSQCPGVGAYLVDRTDDYVSFDLIRDDCAGRVKSTMGFWAPEDYEARMNRLTERISATAEASDRLARGRMYLALGDPARARADLDAYLATDSTDARVWLNHAGTRFPNDLEGVVADCDRAIALEPDRQTAFFLRGLARYGLGEQERGCADFMHAIELGFTVLRQAESERCASFWAP